MVVISGGLDYSVASKRKGAGTQMAKRWKGHNTTYVYYPEYSEKYLVIDGQVCINTAADPGSPVIGRFLRSADEGAGQRGR